MSCSCCSLAFFYIGSRSWSSVSWIVSCRFAEAGSLARTVECALLSVASGPLSISVLRIPEVWSLASSHARLACLWSLVSSVCSTSIVGAWTGQGTASLARFWTLAVSEARSLSATHTSWVVVSCTWHLGTLPVYPVESSLSPVL